MNKNKKILGVCLLILVASVIGYSAGAVIRNLYIDQDAEIKATPQAVLLNEQVLQPQDACLSASSDVASTLPPCRPVSYKIYELAHNADITIELNGPNRKGERWISAEIVCSALADTADSIHPFIVRNGENFTYEEEIEYVADNWKPVVEELWGNPEVDLLTMSNMMVAIRLLDNASLEYMINQALWLEEVVERHKPCWEGGLSA